MKRTLIEPSLCDFPAELHSVIRGAAIYDSSCSQEARVYFIDKEGGFFLKSAPLGSLGREAAMTEFFHKKGLGAEVLDYLSDTEGGRDWFLSRRVAGEDCVAPEYLAQPARLCDILAERLRALHETSLEGCPVPDHTALYLETVDNNYRSGMFDTHFMHGMCPFSTADEAWHTVDQNRGRFKTDVLLHGDYCLPNVMLDGWRFSGFIDLGNGGVGDRHVDIFWGVWSLYYNLKTDAYRDRFLDAYGRDLVDTDMLRVIAAAETFG